MLEIDMIIQLESMINRSKFHYSRCGSNIEVLNKRIGHEMPNLSPNINDHRSDENRLENKEYFSPFIEI